MVEKKKCRNIHHDLTEADALSSKQNKTKPNPKTKIQSKAILFFKVPKILSQYPQKWILKSMDPTHS